MQYSNITKRRASDASMLDFVHIIHLHVIIIIIIIIIIITIIIIHYDSQLLVGSHRVLVH